MAVYRFRHGGDVDALVHRAASLAVMGEVMREALLGYHIPLLVNCLLSLETERVDFGVLQLHDALDGQRESIAQLNIRLDRLLDMYSVLGDQSRPVVTSLNVLVQHGHPVVLGDVVDKGVVDPGARVLFNRSPLGVVLEESAKLA